MFNQFCLRMGTELVPETLYSNELTRLCAREDYIEHIDSVKVTSGNFQTVNMVLNVSDNYTHINLKAPLSTDQPKVFNNLSVHTEAFKGKKNDCFINFNV